LRNSHRTLIKSCLPLRIKSQEVAKKIDFLMNDYLDGFRMIDIESNDSDLVCENSIVESNSTYIFHKILISSSSDIGQKVQKFFLDFENICNREKTKDGLFLCKLFWFYKLRKFYHDRLIASMSAWRRL